MNVRLLFHFHDAMQKTDESNWGNDYDVCGGNMICMNPTLENDQRTKLKCSAPPRVNRSRRKLQLHAVIFK